MAQVNGFVVVANFACFVLFYSLRFVLGFYFLRVCVMLFGFVVVVAAGYHWTLLSLLLLLLQPQMVRRERYELKRLLVMLLNCVSLCVWWVCMYASENETNSKCIFAFWYFPQNFFWLLRFILFAIYCVSHSTVVCSYPFPFVPVCLPWTWYYFVAADVVGCCFASRLLLLMLLLYHHHHHHHHSALLSVLCFRLFLCTFFRHEINNLLQIVLH